MRLIFTAAADSDLHDVYGWYEIEKKGLGEEFLLEVNKTLPYLIRNPRSFRVKYKRMRYVQLARFPYFIYFRIEPDVITVYRIVLAHRNRKKIKI